MTPANTHAARVLIRRRHPSRDAVEGLLSALVLVLIIRHFAFEVFKIPTGSMAPTLLGQHRDLVCGNCHYPFPFNSTAGSPVDRRNEETRHAQCPNCGYQFTEAEVLREHCDCFPSWPKRFFWRGGNRVIVNKFASRMRTPERWDVVVFKFPDDVPQAQRQPPRYFLGIRQHTNFIKRLVGLPGDHVSIRHGDIYVNGQIAPKPPDVQKDIWQTVFDSRYVPNAAFWPFAPRWRALLGDARAGDDGSVSLKPSPTSPARIHYEPRILDFAAYNDLDRNIGLRPVGDLRWEVRVRMDKPGTLRFGIGEDDHVYVGSVTFGEEPTGAISVDGAERVNARLTAKNGAEHLISFSNVDNRLELSVDGQPALTYVHDLALGETAAEAFANDAWIEADGAEATLVRVRLSRDIYYVTATLPQDARTPTGVYDVPPGRYFVLGDNTRNSQDSRYWGTFPEANLIGQAVVVWWPLNHLQSLR